MDSFRMLEVMIVFVPRLSLKDYGKGPVESNTLGRLRFDKG